jgi:Rieske Fe-S protein
VTQEPQQDTRPTRSTRRGVLAGVGLVGLAGAVSACSSGGSSSSSAATGAGAAPSSASGNGGSAAAQGSALATTSEIPVGSGKIFTSEKVVVTQPSSGDIKAFSAVCTHMGCLVSTVSNGTIDCPCHGSQYSISTGAVVSGPAPSPLPAAPIKVTGTNIFLS